MDVPSPLIPADDGAAEHLPGRALPRVALPSTAGEMIALHALGTDRTVIYAYPKIGRPGTASPEGWNSIPGARGCTPESCGFRDHYGELQNAGATRVFGLSSQETDEQQEAVERLHLPFEILSDPTLKLANEIGLPTFEAGGSTLYKRLTLIVRDRLIEHVFYPVFPPEEHALQVLAWLKANPD